MSTLHTKQLSLSSYASACKYTNSLSCKTYLIKNTVSSSIGLEVKISILDCYGSHTVIRTSTSRLQDLAQHPRSVAGLGLDPTRANVCTSSGSSRLLLSCCFFSIHHFILIRDAQELDSIILSYCSPPSTFFSKRVF